MVKVILTTEVSGQGKRGDIIDVSEGFARNYLIPQKKASIATTQAIKELEESKRKIVQEENKHEKENMLIKNKIEKLGEVEIQKQAKKGKLFGSVTAKEIIEILAQKEVKIDQKQVRFENPIKTTGQHKVKIILNKKVEAELKILVK